MPNQPITTQPPDILNKAQPPSDDVEVLEARLLSFAKNCVNDAAPYRNDVTKVIERMRSLYAGVPQYEAHGKNESRPFGQRVNIVELGVGEMHFPNTHSGEASANVQSVAAAFVAAVFSNERPFDAVPYNEGDRDRARLVRDAIWFSMDQQHIYCGTTFKTALKDAMKRFLKYSATVVRSDVAETIVEDKKNGPQIQSNPIVRTIPRQNILLANPARSGMQRQDQPFIAEFFNTSLESLYANEKVMRKYPIKAIIRDTITGEIELNDDGGKKIIEKIVEIPEGWYQNLDKIHAKAHSDRTETDNKASSQERESSQISDATQTSLTEFPSLRGYEVWAQNPIPRWLKTGSEGVTRGQVKRLAAKWELAEARLLSANEDLVLTYVEDDTLICTRLNWFKHKRRPYHSSRYEDLDDRFDGLSLLMRQENPQEMQDTANGLFFFNSLKTLFGSRIRDKRLQMDEDDEKELFKVGGQAEADPSDIPGQSLANAFYEIKSGNFLNEALAVIKLTSDQMARLSIPFNTPAATPNSSATESRLNATLAQQKLAMAFDQFVSDILLPVLEDFRDLLKQYKTEEWTIRVFGEKGLEWHRVSPTDLQTDVDIKIVADLSSADGQLKATYLTNMLNVVGGKVPQEIFNETYRLALELLRFREDRINQIVPRGERETPQETENIALLHDEAVLVRLSDNHQQHILTMLKVPREQWNQAMIDHFGDHLKMAEFMRAATQEGMTDPQAAAIFLAKLKDMGTTLGKAAAQNPEVLQMVKTYSDNMAAQQNAQQQPPQQTEQPPSPEDMMPDQTATMALGTAR